LYAIPDGKPLTLFLELLKRIKPAEPVKMRPDDDPPSGRDVW